MSTLHIYRASAGSGKTFTLTRKYLEKALADPQNFSRIAALTFTNKATAEMKARIFNTLNQLARGNENQHVEYLCEKLQLTPAEITVRADLLRRYILADYKDFTVTTLDKFFQRILRSFAREINVDTSYEPELDYGKVMDEIVNQLTEELRPGMPLTDWISEYLIDKLEEGKSRDFRSVIKGLGMKIFDEDFRAIAHELENIEDTYQTLRTFKNSLYQQKNILEEQAASIGTLALEIMERYDLLPEDFTGGSRSAFRYFRNWASGEIGDMKDSFLKLQCEADKWYAKSVPADKKEAIQAAYHNGLFEAVNNIIRFYAEYETIYRSLTAASKNLFVFGIFSELIKKLENYRTENNVLLLADAVDLLRNLTKLDDAPFIYEKTGTRYDTYLLDEFQDTSKFQWDCTIPLVHNTLSEGNENLLVGDPKQSIYRWRGGDRELINSQVGKQFPNHEVHQLVTNYRSRKNVIGFNNAVFSLLPEIIFSELEGEFHDKNEVNEGLELLRCTYQDVVQQWSGKHDGGYVNVRFFEKNETDEEENYANEKALIETVKSLQDRGFKAKDIAVLVRKNAEAKLAADILQGEKWKNPDTTYVFDIISDEASYLENSSALSLLIHAAQFMLNPLDAVNNSGLLFEWNTIHPLSIPREKILAASQEPEQVRALLPSEFGGHETELLRKAPGPLFDSLVRIFGLSNHSDDFSYLATFRDLVTEFSSSNDPDLRSFLDYWHEKGRRQSVKAPDDAEAIRIMTFHKCKGLEFEAVIIPFFSEKTDHGSIHSVPLWVRNEHEPFNSLPYFPVDYSSKLKQTIFSENYFRERLEAVSDALNLAYVAFTRAKTELHIFAQKPTEKSTASVTANLGHLLYHIAKTKPPIPSGKNFSQIYVDDEENITLTSGEPQAFVREENNKPDIEKIFLPAYPTTEMGEKLKLRVKENPAFYSEERRRGILLHFILGELRHEKDTENLINNLTAAGQLSESEKSETLEGMQQLLADVDVKKLFSEEAHIKTETALITSRGILKIPDRIAILPNQVIVGDFKTGKKDVSHIKQVEEYMTLLQEMGHKNVTGILLYTATGETVKMSV